jgi:hypothetical protein
MIDNTLVLALLPVVIALVQVAKALRLPDVLAPLASLLLGIGAAALWGTGSWRDLSLTGVVIGLSAGGFYSGVTNTRSSIALKQQLRRSVRARSDD